MLSELISHLLEFQQGKRPLEEILHDIAQQPFENFSIGKIDHLRSLRTGLPEVILAEGKDPHDVAELFHAYAQSKREVFATRSTPEIDELLQNSENNYWHAKEARIWATYDPFSPEFVSKNKELQKFTTAIVSAGTLDRPVAEEAKASAQLLGLRVDTCYDVGVAGLNRLLASLPHIRSADLLIVVAGMDAALPTVLAGLLDSPIIAVPTSVGYGASFHGLAPLLSMLNACSPGVVVCNIDNGFGAASHALKITRLLAKYQH